MQNPVRGGDRSCNGTNGSKIVPTDRPRANLPDADNHRIVRADAIRIHTADRKVSTVRGQLQPNGMEFRQSDSNVHFSSHPLSQ